MISWNGSTNGYRSFIESNRKTGVTVVFAGNLLTGAVDKARRALPRVAAGEPIPTPDRLNVKAYPLSADKLHAYEGMYQVAGAELTAVADSALLVIGGWTFVPTGEHERFALTDYGDVRAVLDGAGRVKRLDWTSRGSTLECPKIR